MQQDDRQDNAYDDHDDAHEQALAGFLRPNIDELCLSGGHRRLAVGFFIHFFNLRLALSGLRGLFLINAAGADR
jgi:hypothetical protein